MKKETKLDFEAIKDPQKITKVTEGAIKDLGLNPALDDTDIVDDFDIKQRVLRVKTPTKYFFMGT